MKNLREGLSLCAKKECLSELLKGFTRSQHETLLFDWPLWARKDQLPPLGNWLLWLIMGGRGAGKTRAGAEWVKGMALGRRPFCGRSVGRIALIGETFADVRDVMIEGVSGILSVHGKWERPIWKKTQRQLEWKNGAIAQAFSSEDPDSLRGPQFDVAWSDELCKWRYAEETWDMLQFGLRLGERPRQLVTTTPRSMPLLCRLMRDPHTILTKSTTMANAAHLSEGFLEMVKERYEGSRLGRQELNGELIEDRQDSLWQRNQIEKLMVKKAPELERVVVAIDPPVSAHKKSDACGLVVAGLAPDGHAYILADETLSQAAPLRWAKAAIELYHTYQAGRIVAEVNQGGDMVTSILQQVDAQVPVKAVRANRGKYIRAEPIALLYERGLIHHVGSLPKLEDELCDFGLDGLSSGKSPDRLDALVWALSDLMLIINKNPKIRNI